MTAARLVAGYALALTLAVTGPLFRPGYLLIRDAVSTPRSYLSDAALGISEAAPRAVPQDFAIGVLSTVIDGGFLVKALLIAAVFLAGWGAGRLAGLLIPEARVPGGLIAATLAVWNPYVAERLLQGHWSLLLGYGCLPWVAAAVIRLRTSVRGAHWAALVFWVTLAGFTPTGLILAVITALTCVAVPGAGVSRMRCATASSAVAVLAASPWLVASGLGDALDGPQSAGLAPFAARAEPGLGALGSLAGLGGIWNADAVPHSRTTLFALVATLVLLAVVAAGLPTAARRPQAVPLLVLAGVSVLVPAALATGPGLSLLRAGVDCVPGLAVLRDAQKWVGLAMPGYAVAGSGAVVALRRRCPAWASAAVCCVALIAVLPDLAWGAWGKVTPVRYPAAWPAVAAAINADPQPVAVLPADSTRRFGWSGSAAVLDPLPRWVRAEVLSTGDLRVSGGTVAGEGAHARVVQDLLLAGADPDALRRAGVGWVVVEGGTPGATGDAERTLRQLPVAYRDADLTLYRVGGSGQPASTTKRAMAIGAHLVWASTLLGSAIAMAAGWLLSLRRSGPRLPRTAGG